jgi:hypothetical protein
MSVASHRCMTPLRLNSTSSSRRLSNAVSPLFSIKKEARQRPSAAFSALKLEAERLCRRRRPDADYDERRERRNKTGSHDVSLLARCGLGSARRTDATAGAGWLGKRTE